MRQHTSTKLIMQAILCTCLRSVSFEASNCTKSDLKSFGLLWQVSMLANAHMTGQARACHTVQPTARASGCLLIWLFAQAFRQVRQLQSCTTY
jgi:hypothetical protein